MNDGALDFYEIIRVIGLISIYCCRYGTPYNSQSIGQCCSTTKTMITKHGIFSFASLVRGAVHHWWVPSSLYLIELFMRTEITPNKSTDCPIHLIQFLASSERLWLCIWINIPLIEIVTRKIFIHNVFRSENCVSSRYRIHDNELSHGLLHPSNYDDEVQLCGGCCASWIQMIEYNFASAFFLFSILQPQAYVKVCSYTLRTYTYEGYNFRRHL